MNTEVVAQHTLFYKVRMTEVSTVLLQELYGVPNHPLGFGWTIQTAWGEVTVIKDYEHDNAWSVYCDSDTAKTAVDLTLDLIYEVI